MTEADPEAPLGRHYAHCTFGKDVSQDYDPFKKLFLSTVWTKVRIFVLKMNHTEN